MTEVVRSAVDVRTRVRRLRADGKRIAFVPTMGALHGGHLSLVTTGRRVADATVLSIFVNPLQFGPGEDFVTYPRDEEGDISIARAHGVDLVFVPTGDEMYPRGAATTVSVGPLSQRVEGASRPGHFDGVATVVAKLFNLVQPDVAVFGQKDAQQVAVVKRMVADLSFPVEIVVSETVREDDGLALSSRNVRLSSAARGRATALFDALGVGRAALDDGGTPGHAEEAMRRALATPGVEVDYAAAVDPDSFEPAIGEGDVLLAVAARVGGVRLIDNLLVKR